MNPLQRLREDRQSARSVDDNNADICFLALSDEGRPTVRTLVLREVTDQGLTLFVNKTSPKWEIMQRNSSAEVLIWYPSIQRQYRLSGKIEELDRSGIEKNWPRRPVGSKYLDHAYESLGPQSSPVDSRKTVVEHIEAHRKRQQEEDLTVPQSATGILVRVNLIDCLDLNHQDRIHDRRRFDLVDGDWQVTQLIP